jgi:hypothetical protein
MDHHTVAAVSIVGTCLDVTGSLYLAYDLLGGQHGPLRLLTRAVTYSVVMGIGYGVGLGLFFGLVSGIATGITLSIEFNRAARGLDHYSLPWEALFSAIRGIAFGVAARPNTTIFMPATIRLFSAPDLAVCCAVKKSFFSAKLLPRAYIPRRVF